MPYADDQYVQCRVIKKNGQRCWGAEMKNGYYAGLGICYFHIAQALVQGKKHQSPLELQRAGTLRLIKREAFG